MNQNVENRQRKQVNQWECNRNLEISIAHHDRLPFHSMERWGDVGEEKKDQKDYFLRQGSERGSGHYLSESLTVVGETLFV